MLKEWDTLKNTIEAVATDLRMVSKTLHLPAMPIVLVDLAEVLESVASDEPFDPFTRRATILTIKDICEDLLQVRHYAEDADCDVLSVRIGCARNSIYPALWAYNDCAN